MTLNRNSTKVHANALTSQILPTDLDLICFDPNRRLCIKLRPSILHLAWNFVFSLVICLTIGKVCGFVLGATLGFETVMNLITMTVALFACFFNVKRASVLDIALDIPSYKFKYPTGYAHIHGIPELFVTEPKKNIDGWVCSLVFHGYKISTSCPTRTLEEAKQAFETFLVWLNSYLQNETVLAIDEVEGDVKTAGTFEPLTSGTDIGKSQKTPLVILIHGTYGRASKWAHPDKSVLKAGIIDHLKKDSANPKIDIERFEWSGKNKGAARLKAAEDLKQLLRLKISAGIKPIFLVAHSHGGNIAKQAYHELPKCYQSRVFCILMATPFLKLEQRFKLENLFRLLPDALKDSFGGACFFGFYFWCFVAIFKLESFFFESDRFRQIVSGSEVGTIQDTVYIILFFAPFPLFFFLHSRIKKLFEPPKQFNWESAEKDYASPHHSSNIHVISYSQDEVYQALSLVINVISIIHQMVFFSLVMLIRIMSVARVLDLSLRILLYVFFISFILIVGLFGVFIFFDAISSDWSISSISPEFEEEIFSVISIVVTSIFLFLIGFGALCVLVLTGMIVFGILRLCLFRVIGILDEVKKPVDVLSVLLGTMSISTVPIGGATTYILEGKSLFNHTKIYNHEDTIKYIARLISAC